MLDEAIGIINSGEASCVVIKGGRIAHMADGRGVSPLLALLKQNPDVLKDAFVVDKIIGKAAAMLLALGGANRAYGLIMSAAGCEYLMKNGIAAEYGKCVSAILGRGDVGVCPIEKSVMGIEDPNEGLDAIREALEKLKNAAAQNEKQ